MSRWVRKPRTQHSNTVCQCEETRESETIACILGLLPWSSECRGLPWWEGAGEHPPGQALSGCYSNRELDSVWGSVYFGASHLTLKRPGEKCGVWLLPIPLGLSWHPALPQQDTLQAPPQPFLPSVAECHGALSKEQASEEYPSLWRGCW